MRIGHALALLGAIALGAGLAGCRGGRSDDEPRQFLPDMDDSPKWEPQAGSTFFAAAGATDAAEHGGPAPLARMMRQPVAGSVPFGAIPVVASEGQFDPALRDDMRAERAGYLRPDDAVYLGVAEDGAFVDRIPVDVTRALLERGEERFNIYCAACHGYAGDGNGMVGRRWGVPVANFHDPKYSDPAQRTGKDGYLFHTARHGLKNPDGSLRMPGYGHALDAEDSWAVVAYIRALQAAGVGNPPAAPAAAQEGSQ
ncbi:MAG: c-type cytochrome [Phycisphaerales bacterium JB039]